MNPITDDYMQDMLRTTKPYTAVILHPTPKRDEPGADAVVWEHGRRNFELRRDGLMRIVCPVVGEEAGTAGICIFAADVQATRSIMEGDPAVKAGIFTYEVLSVRSFPGDVLI